MLRMRKQFTSLQGFSNIKALRVYLKKSQFQLLLTFMQCSYTLSIISRRFDIHKHDKKVVISMKDTHISEYFFYYSFANNGKSDSRNSRILQAT